METVWLSRSIATRSGLGPLESEQEVRKYLDDTLEGLSLKWSLDYAAKVITLDLAWKTVDFRTPSELLHAVYDGGTHRANADMPRWAADFDALLTNPTNYETDWKVRQKASLQNVFPMADRLNPILMKPVIGASGEKYVFVLLNQHIQMYPGHGSVSYYWFKDNGALAGAGLMNTGWRCAVVDTTVEQESGLRSGDTSELRMILKVNLSRFFIARFILQPAGLKLVHLMDAHGDEVENGLGIGQSLMIPDHQRDTIPVK